MSPLNNALDLPSLEEVEARMRRRNLLEHIERQMIAQCKVLAAAVDAGLPDEEQIGCMMKAMMRGLRRINAQPDDDEISDRGQRVLVAGLAQIAVNALCALEELGVSELPVQAFRFDTEALG